MGKTSYRTMDPSFMESSWWVFKQLFDKGQVYRALRVMPFSAACQTALSNFEVSQNYKDMVDPSVLVTFPRHDKGSLSTLLIGTIRNSNSEIQFEMTL
jgi:isoleucyl-tRNA synthetase